MSNENGAAPCQPSIQGKSVYLVSNYGRVYAVYANFEDAAQIFKTFIAKGQVAELSTQIIK